MVYRSGDGVSFTDYTAVTTAVAWANAKTVLPAHERWGVWDEGVLDVLVQSPGLEFESRTEREVLDGAICCWSARRSSSSSTRSR